MQPLRHSGYTVAAQLQHSRRTAAASLCWLLGVAPLRQHVQLPLGLFPPRIVSATLLINIANFSCNILGIIDLESSPHQVPTKKLVTNFGKFVPSLGQHPTEHLLTCLDCYNPAIRPERSGQNPDPGHYSGQVRRFFVCMCILFSSGSGSVHVVAVVVCVPCIQFLHINILCVAPQ